ncbi:hypothetical protein Nepgr_001610 [Nepenthes gracilis]|uniref:Uncharacterized protein n=1 Tax=Nepenthes gracilis TaxID=150966 RepID=A0AAD3P4S7_NEPGR|nr:hypothetical protein Nepgr_001610 [Nepenthes gracilis]
MGGCLHTLLRQTLNGVAGELSHDLRNDLCAEPHGVLDEAVGCRVVFAATMDTAFAQAFCLAFISSSYLALRTPAVAATAAAAASCSRADVILK